ncbi:tyrosine-type recombinase/integrase [Flammeovirga sp. EKP202]|uniref:tyrosine-type recombinase/integrase n=1 Tax=Flammeovirga sp. EKP202 TaxID=2770592 RepID=UPI00165FE1DC|nr:tyrosine-type recombinase/integrase [Flammeovirga sp. EKP202]MBD0402929.1 tyrosine-type recombinase/integrase [Flammeovirga sp. EKP202]
MATAKFFLKDQGNERGKSLIMLILRDGKKRLRISTGVSVKNPKHWKHEKQIINDGGSSSREYNIFLKDFQAKALKIFLNAKNMGLDIDASYLREKLDTKQKAVSTKAKFWEAWQKHLELKEKKLSVSSIKKFKSLGVHLRGFEEKRNVIFDLDKVDLFLMEALQTYFEEVANLNVQTTAKYLGLFRTFLNWCKMAKITKNEDFREFVIKHQPDTLKVVMTYEELELIKNTTFDQSKYNNAKSLFLLSCWTGLRFGDGSRIDESHLKKNDSGFYLAIQQEKTKEAIEIPLTDDCLKIVRALIDGGVHPISNQKLNKYVKELAEILEINEPFEVHEYKGNLVTTKKVPKFELITTHTGRRTFATNLMIKGVSHKIVMSHTGHKDFKSFSKYINVPKSEHANIIRMALGG